MDPEEEVKKGVEMKVELQRLSDQWRLAAQVLQSLAGVYKQMSEVCKKVKMERMNFEREMFAVEVATGAAGSVDTSVVEHLAEMHMESIRMVSSEKAKLEKSLQEFRIAAKLYRLEMEAKMKAKTEELWVLSAKKVELELKWEQWQKMKGTESSKTTSDGPVIATASHFGNFANYAHLGKGTQAQALASIYRPNIEWVIDSGASKHVTGTSSSFKSYTSHSLSETIQTADGTSQPIHGVGSVECNPSLCLSSVLHVPSFLVNLLSVSSLIDQFKCTVTFDESSCIFQEKRTGRVIGTGVRRDGLWLINHAESALAAAAEAKEREIFLLHRRLGHFPFEGLSKLFPDNFKDVDRSKLVCDACELGKHTRTTYPSIGLRSCEPFMLIHSDVWGPCSVTSVSGFKWFVTFIDCYTRMTWVYMLRGKHEVFRCFQDFHKLVENQFNARI